MLRPDQRVAASQRPPNGCKHEPVSRREDYSASIVQQLGAVSVSPSLFQPTQLRRTQPFLSRFTLHTRFFPPGSRFARSHRSSMPGFLGACRRTDRQPLLVLDAGRARPCGQDDRGRYSIQSGGQYHSSSPAIRGSGNRTVRSCSLRELSLHLSAALTPTRSCGHAPLCGHERAVLVHESATDRPFPINHSR
jgi:hypothetical protein